MTGSTDYRNRKLYRSQSNRMIGGVCGGFAEYFNIDPNLMRLLWVVLVFLGGSGIIIYLASLLIIPNNPEQTIPEAGESFIKDKPLFWGSLLIVIGGFLLLKQLGLFYSFRFWHIPWQSIWAVVLIVAGGALLFNKSKTSHEEGNNETVAKRLYRSRLQKMIGGVCGGIAVYFDLDVSVVRILWVIATLLSAGVGILVYLIMLIVFPEQPNEIDEKVQ
jgi:phage shock protein C